MSGSTRHSPQGLCIFSPHVCRIVVLMPWGDTFSWGDIQDAIDLQVAATARDPGVPTSAVAIDPNQKDWEGLRLCHWRRGLHLDCSDQRGSAWCSFPHRNCGRTWIVIPGRDRWVKVHTTSCSVMGGLGKTMHEWGRKEQMSTSFGPTVNFKDGDWQVRPFSLPVLSAPPCGSCPLNLCGETGMLWYQRRGQWMVTVTTAALTPVLCSRNSVKREKLNRKS